MKTGDLVAIRFTNPDDGDAVELGMITGRNPGSRGAAFHEGFHTYLWVSRSQPVGFVDGNNLPHSRFIHVQVRAGAPPFQNLCQTDWDSIEAVRASDRAKLRKWMAQADALAV